MSHKLYKVEEEEEERRRRRRRRRKEKEEGGAGSQRSKTKSPHKDVGKKIHVFSTVKAAFHFAHNVQRPTGGTGFTAQWRHSHCPGVCRNGSPDAPPRSQ